MVLHIMIKNFGKIESADIALHDLVVFVGNSNSGKTMVMQLIYGIREKLSSFPVTDLRVKKSDLNGQCLLRCDQDWFREMETCINEYLAVHKSQIIESIFGTLISAEEIKIALEAVESEYFVSSVSAYRNREAGGQKTEFNIDTRRYVHGENVKSYNCRISEWNGLEDGTQWLCRPSGVLFCPEKLLRMRDRSSCPQPAQGCSCCTGNILPEERRAAS